MRHKQNCNKSSFSYILSFTLKTNTENTLLTVALWCCCLLRCLLLLCSKNVTMHSSIILFLRLTFEISPLLHHVSSFSGVQMETCDSDLHKVITQFKSDSCCHAFLGIQASKEEAATANLDLLLQVCVSFRV